MRSLPEIISDMRDIAKLLRSRQAVGMSEAELLTTIEMLAIDMQHLAKHVSLVDQQQRSLDGARPVGPPLP
jgi:hypothetical protein